MAEERVRQQRDEIIAADGPWTAYSIHLGDDLYTFDYPINDPRLRRFLQIASDIVAKPLDTLRVLDLACLEGHYGIEFALHGASVVAIEGREVNLAKTRFAKDALSLNNLELVQDDVRNLSRARYGEFDVVLCLGILYHLDTPDTMDLVKNVFEVCKRAAIIDTLFDTVGTESYVWNGNVYRGGYWQEHSPDATEEEQLEKLWHSIGNSRAFVLTRASLQNLLRHVGFTSTYECLNPYEYVHPEWPLPATDDRHVIVRDRSTFLAIKGEPQRVMSSPITEATAEIDVPEKPEYYVPRKIPRPNGKRRARGA